eukprot:7378595-Pyramimonas_sp.AAC.1
MFVVSLSNVGVVPFGGMYTGSMHIACPCTGILTLATLPVMPCDPGGASVRCTPRAYCPEELPARET